MTNIDPFNTPLRSGKVRKGVYYHQYNTGVINIMGAKYVGYSIKDAVSLYRKQYPKYPKK